MDLLADPGPAVGTAVPGCASTCLGTACSGKPFHGEEFKESCWNPQPGSALGHPRGCCPCFRGGLWSLPTVTPWGCHLRASISTVAAAWVGFVFFFGVALFCIFKPARRNTESSPGAVQDTLQRLNFCCSSQNQFEKGQHPVRPAREPVGWESSGPVALPIQEQQEFSKLGLKKKKKNSRKR